MQLLFMIKVLIKNVKVKKDKILNIRFSPFDCLAPKRLSNYMAYPIFWLKLSVSDENDSKDLLFNIYILIAKTKRDMLPLKHNSIILIV